MGIFGEAFAAYAQPLLDQTDGSEGQLNKALVISQLCFNLALMPEESRTQELSEMGPSLQMDAAEFDDFRRSIVLPMILRHQEMFPQMHQRGGPNLPQSGGSLGARPRVAVSAKAYTTTDRYAPCPCNSGRKYKFCCGKKGQLLC